MQTACNSKQSTAVRDALIHWAKTRWPQDPPNNLEDIAMLLPTDTAMNINRLSTSLYGQDKDNWDAEAIWQAIKGLPTSSDKGGSKNDDHLEPLYR